MNCRRRRDAAGAIEGKRPHTHRMAWRTVGTSGTDGLGQIVRITMHEDAVRAQAFQARRIVEM